jgi:hypothetical protein
VLLVALLVLLLVMMLVLLLVLVPLPALLQHLPCEAARESCLDPAVGVGTAVRVLVVGRVLMVLAVLLVVMIVAMVVLLVVLFGGLVGVGVPLLLHPSVVQLAVETDPLWTTLVSLCVLSALSLVLQRPSLWHERPWRVLPRVNCHGRTV